MSYSGDAAEQVVRLSLETGEVAVKLAGSGAKQLAIMLHAILREQKKTKGKTRLANMLRSGKELKETIDTNTYGQSRGRSGCYSTNWQLAGRELLTPDEVRMLDNQYALLFIRGERPIQDFKYDILKHPHVKLTTDGGAEPYRHGEDTRSIVSIQLDPQLLKQAAEPESDAAEKHDFILLTEEELEEYITNHGGTTK